MKGSVPIKFYIRFFTGPGVLTSFFMFLFTTLAQFSLVASDWWVGEWSNNLLKLTEARYL